jgi:hypothetical protein
VKFKTTIAALAAVAVFAIPATTMAAEDNSPTINGWAMKDYTLKQDTSYSPLPQGTTGRDNSQIIHNGWSVGGNKHQLATSVPSGGDQTTEPGSRAAGVTAANANDALGH